ncbi:MAG: T9SS type A sorting domain-containing protein [Flavobacteriales bacterium]|nr:T9SS type A sorting domain-containing protein [Flavobacteriales bacterium]
MNLKILPFFVLILTFSFVEGQSDYKYQSKDIVSPKLQTGNFGKNADRILQFTEDIVAPSPSGDYLKAKQIVNKQREKYYDQLRKSSRVLDNFSVTEPELEKDFDGQEIGSRGIPNDNHIAVSKGGMVVSVQNSSIRVLDEGGNTLLYKTLFQFARGEVLGFTNYCYDPKVVYDPQADRFILFFLHESKVASNFGVIAFTESNDPAGAWHFYKIPGNPLLNDKWSDYPILAISAEDVFVTLNLLTEGMDWRDGFNQSLIWQMNKKSGYDGEDSLKQRVYYDIRYKDKAIWSICPVQGGFMPSNPEMYFLSVRPGDLENDTLFVHKLSNTLSSNSAILSLKILKADQTYGVPPVAPQPTGYDTLQTNDTRVLSAIFHQGKIQYVQTSVIKPYYHSGILHGMFDTEKSEEVEINFIGNDSSDFAYPSICYAGGGSASDQTSVITFSHVTSHKFPGTSAVLHSRIGNFKSGFSNPLIIKEGVKGIERLPFEQVKHERWGDYTGIQYQYNDPGIVWLVGSYGNENALNGTWIGKLNVKNGIQVATDFFTPVYPNPSSGKTVLTFYQSNGKKLKGVLSDDNGKVVSVLFDTYYTSGYHEIDFQMDELSSGLYFIMVTDESNRKVFSSRILK